MGAVIHRAAVPLGNDILGESVGALIAALEDVDSPMQDEEHWSDIAADRWEDPVRSLDDRPLLPKALAATVTLPFDLPDDGAMEARRAATEAWMREEAGLPDESPFAIRRSKKPAWPTRCRAPSATTAAESGCGGRGGARGAGGWSAAARGSWLRAAGSRRAGASRAGGARSAPRRGNHQTPPHTLWRGVRDGHGRARAQCGHRRP